MTQVRDDEQVELIKFAVKDGASFDALFDQYSGLVYNLAFRFSQNRADADDISQEVWLKVYQRLGSLRSSRAFSSWLWQIASRVCLDRARKLRKIEPLSEDLHTGGSLEDDVANASEAQLAWQALACLPPKQKLALYLREVEDLDYREIARAIGTSVGSVAMSLFRARKQLATSYQELYTSPSARCRLSRKLMAALVDDEGDEVSKRALRAHLDSCPACEHTNAELKRGSRTYGALPIVPSWAARLLSQPFVTQAASSQVSALAVIGSHLQQALIPVLATAGLAVASLTLPVVSQDVPTSGGKLESPTEVARSGSTGPLVSSAANGLPAASPFADVAKTPMLLVAPSLLDRGVPSASQLAGLPPHNQATGEPASSETEPGSIVDLPQTEIEDSTPRLPAGLELPLIESRPPSMGHLFPELPKLRLPAATIPVLPVSTLLPTVPTTIATFPVVNLADVLPVGTGLLTPGNPLPATLPPLTFPNVPSINPPVVPSAVPPLVAPVTLPSVVSPVLPTLQPGSSAAPPAGLPPVQLPTVPAVMPFIASAQGAGKNSPPSMHLPVAIPPVPLIPGLGGQR
jgi:RNA polymerase sigma-70 factor, ECF subfamily